MHAPGSTRLPHRGGGSSSRDGWARAGCALLTGAVLLGSGCASVTVATGEGTISARGLFGTSVRTLALAPVSIRRQGIGVHQDHDSMTLGWLSESAVYLPTGDDSCRIVLVDSDPTQLGELLDVLRKGGADMATVCSPPSGGKP
jgi:hypothetical protein